MNGYLTYQLLFDSVFLKQLLANDFDSARFILIRIVYLIARCKGSLAKESTEEVLFDKVVAIFCHYFFLDIIGWFLVERILMRSEQVVTVVRLFLIWTKFAYLLHDKFFNYCYLCWQCTKIYNTNIIIVLRLSHK